jgi:hypothetical protein
MMLITGFLQSYLKETESNYKLPCQTTTTSHKNSFALAETPGAWGDLHSGKPFDKKIDYDRIVDLDV